MVTFILVYVAGLNRFLPGDEIKPTQQVLWNGDECNMLKVTKIKLENINTSFLSRKPSFPQNPPLKNHYKLVQQKQNS